MVPAGFVEPVPVPVPEAAAGRCDAPGVALAGRPAVLMTTIVTMAATTRPTGISAANMGCRPRKVVGGGADSDCRRRDSAPDAPLPCWAEVLPVGPVAFLLVVFEVFLAAGRVTCDGPVVVFGIGVVLLNWPRRRSAHAFGSSVWGPEDGLPCRWDRRHRAPRWA